MSEGRYKFERTTNMFSQAAPRSGFVTLGKTRYLAFDSLRRDIELRVAPRQALNHA